MARYIKPTRLLIAVMVPVFMGCGVVGCASGLPDNNEHRNDSAVIDTGLCPEGDSDRDGVCDTEDTCLGFDDLVDTDSDGTPDGCDPCPLDAPPEDLDGDGYCNSEDRCAVGDDSRDRDNDGIPDACDQPDPGFSHLLLTDTAQDAIYILDLDGNVIQSFDSPVSGVQGVTHDRRYGGFWVVGAADITSLYHLNWFGEMDEQMEITNRVPYEVRGLDFYKSPDVGDLIITVAVNVNDIDVAWGFDPVSGQYVAGTSHIVDGVWFNGYWGIHVTEYEYLEPPLVSLLKNWSTRYTDNTLQFWNGNYSLITTIPLPVSQPRGVASDTEGTFYVVDHGGAQVIHIDETGNLLDSFATPGPQPSGISYDSMSIIP